MAFEREPALCQLAQLYRLPDDTVRSRKDRDAQRVSPRQIKENQEKIPSGIFFSAMIEKKSTADVQKTNCEMEKPRNQEKEFVLYLYHNKT